MENWLNNDIGHVTICMLRDEPSMCTQISFLTFVSSQASRQMNWQTGRQIGGLAGELADWQAN
jgi:hypothetical protein